MIRYYIVLFFICCLSGELFSQASVFKLGKTIHSPKIINIDENFYKPDSATVTKSGAVLYYTNKYLKIRQVKVNLDEIKEIKIRVPKNKIWYGVIMGGSFGFFALLFFQDYYENDVEYVWHGRSKYRVEKKLTLLSKSLFVIGGAVFGGLIGKKVSYNWKTIYRK